MKIAINKTAASVMSIDVEDGISILMHDIFKVEILPTDRVIRNVNIILHLLEEQQVKATFFVLGEVTLAFPKLIRSIADKGHEVGVHGLHHDQLFKLGREKAIEDIYTAKQIIEDTIGAKVFGFRAPAFSLMENSAWALEVISDLGFKYDSSIMPAKASRYGWPGFSKEIIRLELKNGKSLIEVPLSVFNLLGKPVPVGGGGYLRYLPYNFTRKALRTIQQERPAVVYLHPYELDKEKYPDFFYKARSSSDLRTKLPLMFYRLNKKGVKDKLRRLTEDFNFRLIRDVVEELEREGSIAVKHF